jgi:hypothetical protein
MKPFTLRTISRYIQVNPAFEITSDRYHAVNFRHTPVWLCYTLLLDESDLYCEINVALLFILLCGGRTPRVFCTRIRPYSFSY